MSAWADLVRFRSVAGSTTDWVVSSAIGGCQIPSAANVLNGINYKIYAVSDDLTQWEISTGAYNSGTTTFPRTTVLYNSSGTGTATGQSGAGTKINFTLAPQCSVVALAEDLISIEIANAFTTTQKAQAQNNIAVPPTTQSLTSGTAATYTTGTQGGQRATWIEVFMVGGGGGGGGAPSGTGASIAGADGTASSFNSVNANPGKGAAGAAVNVIAAGGAGGTGGTGSATRRQPGAPGGSGENSATTVNPSSVGGSSYFGGGGTGVSGANNGNAGGANTGGGGSGSTNSAVTDNNTAAGGGAGEFVYLLITSPAATYTYTIGPGGAGGVSNQIGGAGGSGFIFVIEHYGS